MKKALALVLALVLALSLGVSAFAIELVHLSPAPVGGTSLIPVTSIDLDENNKSVVVAGKGGTYYVKLDDLAAGKEYKNVTAVANGAVAAEVVTYDPTVFQAIPEIQYEVYDRIAGAYVEVSAEQYAKAEAEGFSESDYDATLPQSYARIQGFCDCLNQAESTTRYEARTENEVTLVKITVENNYSAAYKEGTVKISAVEVEGRKQTNVSAEITIIRDVTIWDYETVKSAAKYGRVLSVASDKGYSDYETALNGYTSADLGSVSVKENPVVVSTTAFRAVAGSELVVEANDCLTVYIDAVANGQKGVNFSAYGVRFNAVSEAVEFGFYGDQVVSSDFEIEVTLDLGDNAGALDYFGLRELFGKKVEEEDVITYYILKDGEYFDEFTVDYMSVDPSDLVELVVKGKAGSTLGQYEIVLEVPAAPAEGEENPNTGAESVIGVVAAMAVVSVAAAAAVSLKK